MKEFIKLCQKSQKQLKCFLSKELQKKYGNSRFRVDRKKNRTKGALDLLGVLDLFHNLFEVKN